jgi:hypothetical protein
MTTETRETVKCPVCLRAWSDFLHGSTERDKCGEHSPEWWAAYRSGFIAGHEERALREESGPSLWQRTFGLMFHFLRTTLDPESSRLHAVCILLQKYGEACDRAVMRGDLASYNERMTVQKALADLLRQYDA